MKFSIFVLLLGLFLISPIAVYGGAATAAPLNPQRIYSVMEMESPSPYHITLVVRTGLNTGDVWIQRADGGNDRGLLVSYGDSQRVWQISHILTQDRVNSLVINANHTLVVDETLISHIYRIGNTDNTITNNHTHAQTTSLSSTVTITPTRLIIESDTEQPVEHAEFHQTITVSNHGSGAQSVSIDTAVVWNGINITGDEPFIQRTLRAMEAVESGPSWAFDYIVTYLDEVKQHSIPRRTGTGGHINVRTRTFYVYNGTYTGNVMWYASALVHEAVHARQYREYLESYGSTPPRRTTFYATFDEQKRIEMEALDIQIRFLEEAGAPKRVIDMAKSFIGTVWWR